MILHKERNFPKGENVFVSYFDKDHVLRFITTAKPARDYYFLYELQDEGFIKLGKSKNPLELESKYIPDRL